jgi:ATP-binding cassette, subfamily B, bacterial PglK
MQTARKNILFQSIDLIPLGHRKKGLWIITLLIISSFLDFFSVASFVPLIFLVINPSFVSSNKFASSIYQVLEFNSVDRLVLFMTICVLGFVLVKNLFSLWIARVKIKYAFDIGELLSIQSILNYLQISYLKFSTVDFTKELNQITNYPFSFANNIIIPITTFISELFIVLLFLIGIGFYDFKMLMVLFAILIPAIALIYFRRKSIEKINQDLKVKYPALLKSALQVVEGYPEIKTYRKEEFFLENFTVLSRHLSKAFVKDQTLQAGTVRFVEVIIGILTCFLIFYTVVAYENYQQTLLILSVYCGASFRMIPSANRIIHSVQQIKMHQYLFDELSDKCSGTYRVETVPAPILFQHSISFHNISFQYPKGPVTLKNISIKIRKGEKVGIIGKSGEGKTSLLLILLRFLSETTGEILVDGEKLSSDTAWRMLVGYVPQNPYILDVTLCENIAFGIPTSKINRKKIFQLIDDLDMRELVNQLPNGIDSRIGERGSTLSGGQKQRLAIARALYTDASILLLDEITNQVHASVEQEIINLLDRLADQKKTIIMVTHKIPRTDFFTSIYRLEGGMLYDQVAPS